MRYFMPFWVVVATASGWAQTTRDAVTIDIETDRGAQWRIDVSDPSRVAASSDPVPPAAMLNFFRSFSIQDVRIVNGIPAKGVVLFRTDRINLNPSPPTGSAIADGIRGTAAEIAIEILDENGAPVGTLVGSGLAGGAAPPGASVRCSPQSTDPSGCLQPVSNIAITGGTGAFLGARGQLVFLPPQFNT